MSDIQAHGQAILDEIIEVLRKHNPETCALIPDSFERVNFLSITIAAAFWEAVNVHLEGDEAELRAYAQQTYLKGLAVARSSKDAPKGPRQ